MAKGNKRNENRPDESIPGKTQVPDIRRDDADLLKRGRTEKGESQKTNYDAVEAGQDQDERSNEEPVRDNSIRP